MSADSCACPTTDPVECIRRRYPGTRFDEAEGDPCTCLCHDVEEEEEEEDDFDDGPDWCDRCSPDPCDCDDGPDDLSDLGPLDENDDRDAIEADVAAGLVYPDCGCGLTRDRLAATFDALEVCDDNIASLGGADPGGRRAFVGTRRDD